MSEKRRCKGRRCDGRLFKPFADLADKSVAIRQCFDVSRFFRGITQGLADFIHGRIQSVVEIDEYVRSPQQLFKLFSATRLACSPQKDREHLKRLWLQPDPNSTLAKFQTDRVRAVRTKRISVCRYRVVVHGESCAGA